MRRPPSKIGRIAGWVLKRWNSSNGLRIRVLVVEPDDEADRDLVVLEVIEERAAIGAPCRAASRRCGRRGPGWCCAGSTSHSSLMPIP